MFDLRPAIMAGEIDCIDVEMSVSKALRQIGPVHCRDSGNDAHEDCKCLENVVAKVIGI